MTSSLFSPYPIKQRNSPGPTSHQQKPRNGEVQPRWARPPPLEASARLPPSTLSTPGRSPTCPAPKEPAQDPDRCRLRLGPRACPQSTGLRVPRPAGWRPHHPEAWQSPGAAPALRWLQGLPPAQPLSSLALPRCLLLDSHSAVLSAARCAPMHRCVRRPGVPLLDSALRRGRAGASVSLLSLRCAPRSSGVR